MGYIKKLCAVILATTALCESANAALISATDHVEPFFGAVQLHFDFGRPLSNILSVSLTMDPCNAFENELPRTCFDTIGLGEPVEVSLAGLSLIFVPADVDQIDLPLTQILLLTPALIADLSDGLIDATTAFPGGATFVDFSIEVVFAEVAEPGGLALLMLALAILVAQRNRKLRYPSPQNCF